MIEWAKIADIDDEPLPFTEQYEWEAYWREVEKLASEQAGGCKEGPEPSLEMTDAEARRFDAEVIPFGLHKGERVKDVDLEYLRRLTDPSQFLRDLKRYLRSARVKNEDD